MKCWESEHFVLTLRLRLCVRPTSPATPCHGRDINWQAERKYPDFPILTPFHHPSFALPARPFNRKPMPWGAAMRLSGDLAPIMQGVGLIFRSSDVECGTTLIG
jgi:hypothetical protein